MKNKKSDTITISKKSLYIFIVAILLIIGVIIFLNNKSQEPELNVQKTNVSKDVANNTWNLALNKAPWVPLVYNSLFTFDGKLWMLGGYGNLKGEQKGIWSSKDGKEWNLTGNLDNKWAEGLIGYKSIVFKHKIWVFGGYSPQYNTHKFAWVSSDGNNWQTVTHDGWSGRTDFEVVEFKNKLWVLGGHNSKDYYLNDVWSSTDGIKWKKEVASALWKKRSNHKVIVYNDKMYLLGGLNEYDALNDVWISENGIDWKVATENAPWAGRFEHASVTTPNGMYVLGGRGYDNWFNDVWFSIDGVHWNKEDTSWKPRSGFSSIYYAGKIWVMNGTDKADLFNDIWTKEL